MIVYTTLRYVNKVNIKTWEKMGWRLTVRRANRVVHPAYLTFRDPYKVIWRISVSEGEFRTAGDFAGRWLPL